jgi:hypothetical protein
MILSDVLTCTVPPLRVESSLLKNPIPPKQKVHFTNAHAFFTNPRQPMACTDTVSDVNNALHKAEDEAAPVITLEYGPYMN